MDTAQAGIESAEELREALFSLRREHAVLAKAGQQAQHLLDALESLLGVEIEDDPFARVFSSLRKVFSFSQAMMLSERDAGEADAEARPLECIVADPAGLVGAHWPVGALFGKVMAGRVVATFSNAGAEEWAGALQARAVLGPRWAEQSALHVPVRTRERRGILVLLREAGAGGFDRGDVALARRFSVLASHALAARYASRTEAEGRRLRELTEQLRSSEQSARRGAELLRELVNALPVGVSVRDAGGRLLLANDVIAEVLEQAADQLLWSTTGPPPRDDIPADDELRRQISFQARLAAGRQRSREQAFELGGTSRTLLVTDKPVRILDESMMLSTTLDISERKRLEQDLERRAFHDALTGLPNRARMQQVVAQALERRREGGMFALAFIDLDNFKQVNDYYSHAIGDGLLKAMAERIERGLRPGDTLARISGDEFLLLIDPLERQEDLAPLLDRLAQRLKQPFVVEGRQLMTSASVGGSIFPLHGDSYESLCRSADGAMYRAKQERKGSAACFDPAMGQALTARMEAEQRLRAALRERRFRVAYQPKLRLADSRVTGFEALVRWVDAEGRVHMPASFIELASELGLLDEITGVVVEKVLGHLPTLCRHFGDEVSVSLNLSPRQAADTAFMDRLVGTLGASAEGRRIVLELTEEALLAAQRFQGQVLPRLRTAGVRVSIDDFGTGYSSLSTLADITADEVKVDRAFITAIHERPRSQGILRAIESLCTALGVEIVAEGVETAEELAYLRQHTAIGLAQGYYFARPEFIEALVAWAPGAADLAQRA